MAGWGTARLQARAHPSILPEGPPASEIQDSFGRRTQTVITIEPADLTSIDTHLEVLRDAVVDVDIKVAVEEAPRLLRAVEAAAQTS